MFPEQAELYAKSTRRYAFASSGREQTGTQQTTHTSFTTHKMPEGLQFIIIIII